MTAPTCRVCGDGVATLGGDLCDLHDGEEIGLGRQPLHHAVAFELGRLGTDPCVLAGDDMVTFAFGYKDINPMFFPTTTVLRHTADVGWFLHDPATGVLLHRFSLNPGAGPRAIARAVSEALHCGLAGDAVREPDDTTELEAALAGAT